MNEPLPSDILLEVRDVSHTFQHRGVRRPALKNVSFDLPAKRTLAIVGESGAGKTTLARIVAGLEQPTKGSVSIEGERPRLTAGRPSPVQMVFQDPGDALNSFLPVGRSVAAPLRQLNRSRRRERTSELLRSVGLDPTRANERPGSFSGGQQQRIVVARALAASPKLLVCDEPTSALDVSVQGQVLNLLLELQDSLGFSVLLVTHDLAVVRVLADEVIVLRHGVVLEHATADDFFANPTHAYSRTLVEEADHSRHDRS